MGERVLIVALTLVLAVGCVSSAPALPQSPAKIFSGLLSNAVSFAMKWLWSLKPSTKTAISGRPMMKFESGFSVETVFDGSKHGIEPHSVEVLPNGELLILDSANSNLYKMSAALSLYSRPRLVAGSPEGYSGHVDGKPREAKMNHPKGLTADDRGNIYVADTNNMAIRKISDSGVTTIAGGKAHGGGHVDGPSEYAKFSNDFDVVYIGSSCSLLVVDRGNQAIREIQLNFDDCAYQYESGFSLGIVVLMAAAFFGYMLALLQRRVGTMVSPQEKPKILETNNAPSQYQTPLKLVRPPLIPSGDELEKQEGFLGSLGKLLIDAAVYVVEIIGSIFPGYKKKPPPSYQYQTLQKQHTAAWTSQDSYEIPYEEEPPSLETRNPSPANSYQFMIEDTEKSRNPTPAKTYPFMTEDAEKVQHQLRKSGARAIYNGWDNGLKKQQHQQQQKHQQQQHQHHQQQQQDQLPRQPQQQKRQHRQQHHLRHYSSPLETLYVRKNNETVNGAVNEQEYKDWLYSQYNIRSQMSSMAYSNGY